MAVVPSVFIFVAVVAIAASWVAMQSRFDNATRVLAGGFSMAAWAIWAFFALNIEIVTSCCRVTRTYRPLAFLGVAAAVIMLLFTVSAAFAMLGDTGGDRIDDLDMNS